MIAPCGLEMSNDSIMPRVKRPCGHYSLVMINLPEADVVIRPTCIPDFFLPIPINGFQYVFSNSSTAKDAKGIWRVVFLSKRDMEMALMEKQWTYMGEHCIRLMTEEDYAKPEDHGTWKSVHRELHLDIFSHFDASQRARLRSVAAQWNVILKTSWDQDVNQCLYFSFVNTSLKYRNVAKDVAKAFNGVTAECGNLCHKISRLIIRFKLKDESHSEYSLTTRWSNSPQPINTFLLDHCHFNTVVIIGLDFSWQTMFDDLFKFNGMVRWPRPLTIWLHDCRIKLLQAFPALMMNRVPGVNGFSASASDTWSYRVPVSDLIFQIDQTGAKKERYMRLEREMDKGRIFWPFPSVQSEWLRAWLGKCPIDSAETLEKNSQGGYYSIRQAIRHYFENDISRRLIDKWEPTGVFFEQYQLTRRDCFFLSALAVHAKCRLLHETPVPPPCGADSFKIEIFFPDSVDDDDVDNEDYSYDYIIFEETSAADQSKFDQAVATMHEDGPGHCKFATY